MNLTREHAKEAICDACGLAARRRRPPPCQFGPRFTQRGLSLNQLCPYGGKLRLGVGEIEALGVNLGMGGTQRRCKPVLRGAFLVRISLSCPRQLAKFGLGRCQFRMQGFDKMCVRRRPRPSGRRVPAYHFDPWLASQTSSEIIPTRHFSAPQ